MKSTAFELVLFTQRVIARRVGVVQQTVSRIRARKAWASVEERHE